MWWVVAAVAVLVLLAAYVAWLAARVDRLHARTAAAQAALDAQLVRRAAAATALADRAGATLGPLAPQLRLAAKIAIDAPAEDRPAAENDLTRQLRAVPLRLTDPLLADAITTSRRVALARQLYDDVVRDTLAMRQRRVVRAFGLARRHPRPAYFDVEDTRLDGGRAAPVNPLTG